MNGDRRLEGLFGVDRDNAAHDIWMRKVSELPLAEQDRLEFLSNLGLDISVLRCANCEGVFTWWKGDAVVLEQAEALVERVVRSVDEGTSRRQFETDLAPTWFEDAP